jgi:hypothetical protein
MAQAEKITISIQPKPGQKIHYTVADEFIHEFIAEGGTAENRPPRPSVKMAGKLIQPYSLVTRDLDQQGRVTGQIAFDQGMAELSFDESAPKKENTPSADLTGMPFTVILGTDGDVIEATAPATEREGLVRFANMIPRMIAEAHAYLPTASLAVGATVSQPLITAVPMQFRPRGPFDIAGSVTLKLIAIETDGTERIAHCEQSYNVTVKYVPDAGALRNHSSVRMVRGTRRVRVNVDRGVLAASEMELTYDNIDTPSRADLPTHKSHGVMKATVTAKYRPTP